jgi:hypothetical protein
MTELSILTKPDARLSSPPFTWVQSQPGKYLLHHHPICTVHTFKHHLLLINLAYQSVCLILHAAADHPVLA